MTIHLFAPLRPPLSMSPLSFHKHALDSQSLPPLKVMHSLLATCSYMTYTTLPYRYLVKIRRDLTHRRPHATHLLRLLRPLLALRPTKIPVQIRRVHSLTQQALDRLPRIPRGGGHTLLRDLGVDARAEVRNGALDEAALGVARAQEDRVQRDEDPAAAAEQQRGAEQAEPEEDLEDGDERHRAVVVVLDEAADGVGKSGGLLRCGAAFAVGRLWACAGSALWGGIDGGEKVGAGVGQYVEDGVDGEGEDGERRLAREEPNESHDCDVLLVTISSGR